MTIEEQEAAREEAWTAAGFHNGVLFGVTATVMAISLVIGTRWMLS